jgi:co-chaperonin GroES (HSP10)
MGVFSYNVDMIQIDVKVGDTILMGRFKNKKVVVKTITYDEHGMPIINGKPACTFRLNTKK